MTDKKPTDAVREFAERYERRIAELEAELNARAERTCYADEVTHRDCKYSVNRGWKERTCRCTTDDNAWCFACSECGKSFPRSRLHFAYNHGEINYCPNCGARVIGTEAGE